MIDNLDDNLFIEVLKKAAEKAKQGIIGSTDDGVNNIIVAVEQVLDAMEHKTNHTVLHNYVVVSFDKPASCI